MAASKKPEPIYVVLDAENEIVSDVIHVNRAQARIDVEHPGDRIVKYIPAPSRRAR